MPLASSRERKSNKARVRVKFAWGSLGKIEKIAAEHQEREHCPRVVVVAAACEQRARPHARIALIDEGPIPWIMHRANRRGTDEHRRAGVRANGTRIGSGYAGERVTVDDSSGADTGEECADPFEIVARARIARSCPVLRNAEGQARRIVLIV